MLDHNKCVWVKNFKLININGLTIKIYICKAFDTACWDSLFETLYLFKFPPSFIEWIKACITSTMFSIKVNGYLAGYFKGSRGLKQRDPLSPYLFILIMELNWGSLQSGYLFHWRTKECRLTHLFFADDILIFCHGSPTPISIINSCIFSFSLFFLSSFLMCIKANVFLLTLIHLFLRTCILSLSVSLYVPYQLDSWVFP